MRRLALCGVLLQAVSAVVNFGSLLPHHSTRWISPVPVGVTEPRAIATGSSDCGFRISDCGFRAGDAESSSPKSEIANPQSDDPVATARGSDTRAVKSRRALITNKRRRRRESWQSNQFPKVTTQSRLI